jgi:hypothetical protein
MRIGWRLQSTALFEFSAVAYNEVVLNVVEPVCCSSAACGFFGVDHY